MGSYPSGASPYGALDMEGKVTQWCSDFYDAEYCKKGDVSNPTGPWSGDHQVQRGGSSISYRDTQIFRSSYRGVYGVFAANYGYEIGFRCVGPD